MDWHLTVLGGMSDGDRAQPDPFSDSDSDC